MSIKLCKKCNSVMLEYSVANQHTRYGHYCLICQKWESDIDEM